MVSAASLALTLTFSRE